jgi:23S rRNA-/tRNA-specific pseudouridylate synthase
VTDYRVLGRHDGTAWLELRPHTGRTHQLRVHCAALGSPVLGDPVYGLAPADGVLHLFARGVVVPFYEGRPPVAVVAPPPSHMLKALSACGYS